MDYSIIVSSSSSSLSLDCLCATRVIIMKSIRHSIAIDDNDIDVINQQHIYLFVRPCNKQLSFRTWFRLRLRSHRNQSTFERKVATIFGSDNMRNNRNFDGMSTFGSSLTAAQQIAIQRSNEQWLTSGEAPSFIVEQLECTGTVIFYFALSWQTCPKWAAEQVNFVCNRLTFILMSLVTCPSFDIIDDGMQTTKNDKLYFNRFSLFVVNSPIA